MWEHLRVEAAKYIAGALILGVVAVGTYEWNTIQDYMSIRLLNFMSAALTADPDYVDDAQQTKRPPDYAQALRDFQEHAVRFSQNLVIGDPEYVDSARTKHRSPTLSRNMREFQSSLVSNLLYMVGGDPAYRDATRKIPQDDPQYGERIKQLQNAMHQLVSADLDKRIHGLIGYAQTGTFLLTTEQNSSEVANRIAEPNNQFPFTIFAPSNSKVLLEFELANFIPGEDALELLLFDQAVCRTRAFHEGFNRFPFEVVNATTGEIKYTGTTNGKCTDQKGKAGAFAAADNDNQSSERGHLDQLVPVRFKLVSAKPDKPAPSHSVQGSYIAMVSPLLPY